MGAKNNQILRIFGGMLAVFCLATPAHAKVAEAGNILASTPDKRQAPVLMDAVSMNYDKETATVTAEGKVEVIQGDSILLADKITYDQNSRVVRAEGHVSVLEGTGNVYFADALALTDDLQAGVIDNFRARLSDNSLFAAREAQKINQTVTKLKKAVYSPCKLCVDKKTGQETGNPLWQIAASKVRVDTADQKITYRNAFFEVYGVPVFYLPYFSHATPGADNKSGFLPPEYSVNRNLGAVVKVPYYYSISPDKDLTLIPYYISDEAPVLAMQYRQKFDAGSMEIFGSATRPDARDAAGNIIAGKTETRGHVRGNGQFSFADYWNWGFDVNRATDDTYLRRYEFGYDTILTSRLFVNRIKDRSYAVMQGLAFQDLQAAADPAQSPIVTPLIKAENETGPLWMGSRFFFSGDSRVILREKGTENRRVSATAGWRLPWVSAGGQVWEFNSSLRADAYSLSDVPQTVGPDFSGTVTRAIPQAELTWRYPLIAPVGGGSVMVEPFADAAISDRGVNDPRISNEDSQAFEFNDANLFSANRTPGLDVVEEGPRASYGLRTQYEWEPGKDIDLMLGQAWRDERADRSLALTTDPLAHTSDYVGRVGLSVAPLDVFYRFQADRDTLAFRRNEVSALFNHSIFNVSANYIELNDHPLLGTQREISATAGLNLTEDWTLTALGRRDLRNGGSMRQAGFGLLYKNECVNLITGVTRDYVRDRDIEPSTNYTVRLLLNNLK